IIRHGIQREAALILDRLSEQSVGWANAGGNIGFGRRAIGCASNKGIAVLDEKSPGLSIGIFGKKSQDIFPEFIQPLLAVHLPRSEERRVGTEGVSTCNS